MTLLELKELFERRGMENVGLREHAEQARNRRQL